ncbi:MAG: hypothetical protein AAFZ92_05360 [Pseudomonadota bacterium]
MNININDNNGFLHSVVSQCSCILLLWILSASSVAQQPNSEKGESDQGKPEGDVLYLKSRIYGDKEQPLVSYFIPWKGTQSPDSLSWQLERKNDDTLNLVDRDIMLRSINIYTEMQLEIKDQ